MHHGSALYPVRSAPYPVEALGPHLSRVVRAIAHATQAPAEIAAQAVLSVVSLAVQNVISVRVPSGEIRPASCFFFTVAPSGECKSAVAGLALAPVRSVEEQLVRLQPRADLDYRARLQAWRLFRARLTRATLREWSLGSGTRGEADAAAVEGTFLHRKPLPPAPPFLISASSHIGSLIDQLKARANLLLFSDTPTPLMRGAKEGGASFLKEMWDNGSAIHGRGRLAQRLVSRRLTIHLTAPPEDAKAIFLDPAYVRDGLLARFLIAAPVSHIGTRAWSIPTVDPCLDDFAQRIQAALGEAADLPADVAEVMTRVVAFSVPAQALWGAFAGEMERRMAVSGDFVTARAVGAKLPQQAARLAALIAGYENHAEIGEDAAKGGIALARWYGAEALRVQSSPFDLGSIACSVETLAWLQRTHPARAFTIADIYRGGPASVRTVRSARAALQVLEREGYVRLSSTGLRGAEAWELTQKC